MLEAVLFRYNLQTRANKDPSPEVRQQAELALQKIGSPRAQDVLAKFSGRED